MFTKGRKVLKDQEEWIDLGRNIYRENKLAEQISLLRKDLKSGHRGGLHRQDLGKEIYQRDNLEQSREESNHSSEFW